jgi:hypothetical protein
VQRRDRAWAFVVAAISHLTTTSLSRSVACATCSRSQFISTDEFYNLLHEKPNLFVDSLFTLIETKKAKQLDFSEFVEVVCTYCMFAKTDVLKCT